MKILYSFKSKYPITVYFNQLYLFGIHKGVDYACPAGTPILAGIDGEVYQSSYGLLAGLKIGVKDGDYNLRNFHCSKSYVHVGQRVSRGEVIGLSGNSGIRTTGAHLHLQFEERGVPIDPLPYMEYSSNMTDDEFRKQFYRAVYPELIRHKLTDDKVMKRRPEIVQDENTGIVWSVKDGKKYKWPSPIQLLVSFFVWRWMTDEEKKYEETKKRKDIYG